MTTNKKPKNLRFGLCFCLYFLNLKTRFFLTSFPFLHVSNEIIITVIFFALYEIFVDVFLVFLVPLMLLCALRIVRSLPYKLLSDTTHY